MIFGQKEKGNEIRMEKRFGKLLPQKALILGN